MLNMVVTNSYSNLSNVVLRLAARAGGKAGGKAVLLNAHFDSTVGTAGASDDLVPVGVALEVLRALLHGPALPRPVIVLLNGAEESLMMGSHAFITQHKWADEVGVVVNLEACGAGGPEILFQVRSVAEVENHNNIATSNNSTEIIMIVCVLQVGSAALAATYTSAALHPHGSSLSQELFQTGFIQSDTDYRIFGAHKGILGMDLAYYQNSYVYHTDLDQLHMLHPGSIQHMGDNVLSLMQALARSDFIDSTAHATTLASHPGVYADIYGRYMVHYSMRTATVLHLLLVATAFAALVARKGWPVRAPRPAHAVWSALLSILASIVAGALLSVATAAVYSLVFKQRLLWFSQPWLLLPFYATPTLLAMLAVQWSWWRRHLTSTTSTTSQQQRQALEWLLLLAVALFHTLLLAALTLAQLGMSFTFFVWAAHSLGMLVYNYCASRAEGRAARGDVAVSGLSYVLAGLVPLLLSLDSMQGIFQTLVPLTGRMGADIPTDIVMALLTSLCTAWLALLLLPFAQRAGRLVSVMRALAVLSVAALVAASILGQPYDGLHPKRIFLQHTIVRGEPQAFVMMASPDAVPIDYVLRPHTPQYAPIHLINTPHTPHTCCRTCCHCHVQEAYASDVSNLSGGVRSGRSSSRSRCAASA